MTNPIYYRTYAIRYSNRHFRPYLVFDTFNPYLPVAKVISITHAYAWIDKKIAAGKSRS